MKNDRYGKFFLRTNLISDIQSQCLSFRFNMKGDSIGSLEVNKIGFDGSMEQIMFEKWRNLGKI